jgi:hypothetical protein
MELIKLYRKEEEFDKYIFKNYFQKNFILPISYIFFVKEIEKKYKIKWNWFATLTFKNEIHPERAYKCLKIFLHQLNRAIFGKRYYKRGEGVIYLLATEYQKRGVMHFHLLLSLIPRKNERRNNNINLKRVEWKEKWKKISNGIARIYPYRNILGAEYYITKYITKDGEIDIYIPWCLCHQGNRIE